VVVGEESESRREIGGESGIPSPPECLACRFQYLIFATPTLGDWTSNTVERSQDKPPNCRARVNQCVSENF